MTKVGEDGYIKLEDGFSRETTLEIIDGSMYLSGYTSFGPLGKHLVTDKSRDVCELEDPAIILYSGKIDDAAYVDQFMKLVMGKDLKNRTPMLIIAHEFSDDVKEFILKQKLQVGIPIAAIRSISDGSSNSRTEIMQDLAAATGATPGAKGILSLDEMNLDHMGGAGRVEIYAKEVVMYKGLGDEKEIIARVDDLKILLSNTVHEFDKENLRARIAKLVGGVGIIKVGGSSDTEIAERKDRAEDALCSAKAAIKDGIIPGGGYTLYSIARKLKGDDIATKILRQALQEPIKKIIENSGQVPEAVLAVLPPNKGYDIINKKAVDLMKVGIVDAALVAKSAVINAVSVAGLLLTTGGAIVEEDVKQGLQEGQFNPLSMLNGLA